MSSSERWVEPRREAMSWLREESGFSEEWRAPFSGEGFVRPESGRVEGADQSREFPEDAWWSGEELEPT